MSKKMPIIVLLLLFVIFLPFAVMTFMMRENPSMVSDKTDLIDDYSSYEKELAELGYNSSIITENGEKYLAIRTEYITFKFSKIDSCTAEFDHKSVSSSKYHGEMAAPKIGEEAIKVTITETYQNMDLEYVCSYSPSGFDTIVIDSSNYDRNDREIKKLIRGEYKLSDIYAQMKSINNNLKEVVKSRK